MNVELSTEARTNIWLGKALLIFGIGFNAFLGFTVGYQLLAFATAAIVALFDFGKVRMVRNAVVSYRMNSQLWFFSGAWVLVLTASSIICAVLFYAWSMTQVANQAHNDSPDVKIAQQAFETSQQQAQSVQGFDVLATQQKITALESQAAAILAKPATNNSGRSVGNIGGRTSGCSASKSYYATKYASECGEYARLITEAQGLRASVGTATTLQQNATQATNAALTAMGNFSLSEGIPGIGVLANMWHPELYATNPKQAEQKAFKNILMGVALITELLATSLLIYGYLLGTAKAPSPTGGARVTGGEPTGNPMPAGAAAFTSSTPRSGVAALTDKVLSAFGEKAAPAPTPEQLTRQQRQANAEKWSKALAARGIPFTGHDDAMEQDASDSTINRVLGEVPTSNEDQHKPEIQTELPLSGGESGTSKKSVCTHSQSGDAHSQPNKCAHTLRATTYTIRGLRLLHMMKSSLMQRVKQSVFAPNAVREHSSNSAFAQRRKGKAVIILSISRRLPTPSLLKLRPRASSQNEATTEKGSAIFTATQEHKR